MEVSGGGSLLTSCSLLTHLANQHSKRHHRAAQVAPGLWSWIPKNITIALPFGCGGRQLRNRTHNTERSGMTSNPTYNWQASSINEKIVLFGYDKAINDER